MVNGDVLTAAARSSCPGAAGLAAPPDRVGATGLAVVGGAGGFGGSFGAPLGLDDNAGAMGLGLVVTGGGGLLAAEFEEVELAGVSLDVLGVFLHGVADPSEGPIPGKTETGFADALAVKDCTGTFGAAGGEGTGLDVGGGRRLGGGGGVGVGLGFGGTSSR